MLTVLWLTEIHYLMLQISSSSNIEYLLPFCAVHICKLRAEIQRIICKIKPIKHVRKHPFFLAYFRGNYYSVIWYYVPLVQGSLFEHHSAQILDPKLFFLSSMKVCTTTKHAEV